MALVENVGCLYTRGMDSSLGFKKHVTHISSTRRRDYTEVGNLGAHHRNMFIHFVLAVVLEQGSNSPEATSYDPVFYYNRIVASFVHSVVKATSAFTFHSYNHHRGCSEYNSVPVDSLKDHLLLRAQRQEYLDLAP